MPAKQGHFYACHKLIISQENERRSFRQIFDLLLSLKNVALNCLLKKDIINQTDIDREV